MRLVDYSKLHCAIDKILLEYTPPTLRNECGEDMRKAYRRRLVCE